jgi:hypothetical protein
MRVALTINLFFLFLIVSCQSSGKFKIKSTNNKGGYTVSIKKNTSLIDKDSITIYGYVKSIEDETLLKGAFVKLGCNSIIVDSNGFFKINERPSEVIYLSCSWIGFKTIETEIFVLESGDSVNVNFYLSTDDRPLINCEGEVD